MNNEMPMETVDVETITLEAPKEKYYGDRDALFNMYITNFHQHAIKRFCADYNKKLSKAVGFGR